jgi:hypothetical protein
MRFGVRKDKKKYEFSESSAVRADPIQVCMRSGAKQFSARPSDDYL